MSYVIEVQHANGRAEYLPPCEFHEVSDFGCQAIGDGDEIISISRTSNETIVVSPSEVRAIKATRDRWIREHAEAGIPFGYPIRTRGV